MSKLIRTALAAVGVIASIAVLGVASAAAADTVSTRSPETRLPVVDGRTIAQVEYTGGSTWAPTEHDLMCEDVANDANQQIAVGFNQLYDGKMADAAAWFGAAVETIRDGESKGCEFD
jgi:hypothetical protein